MGIYHYATRETKIKNLIGMIKSLSPFSLFEMDLDEIYLPGKRRRLVQARSLYCYWKARELGVSATALAKRLNISQPAVSIAVSRGEKIAKAKGFYLLEK